MQIPENTPEAPSECVDPISTAPLGSQPPYTNAIVCQLLSLCAFAGIPLGNIFGPLIFWHFKRAEDPFTEVCGKSVINFQLSVTLYFIGLCALSLLALNIPILRAVLGPFLAIVLLALPLTSLVLVIIGSIKASHGEAYQYPYSIRFLT